MKNPLSLSTARNGGSGPSAPTGVGTSPDACVCDAVKVASACRSNPYGQGTVRGGAFLPVVIPLCGGDGVLNPSVPPLVALPRYAAVGHLARAISLGEANPVSVSDTKVAGQDLTLTMSAPTGTRLRFAALLLEVGTSDDVTPGTTTLSITATDEGGNAISLPAVEIRQSQAGNSQWLIFMVRNVSGLSIPTFAEIRENFVIGAAGEAFALTAGAAPNDATSITFTAGLQAPDLDLVAVITEGAEGTVYTIKTVVPPTEYFDIMAAVVGDFMEKR